jgi:hypothetical protein
LSVFVLTGGGDCEYSSVAYATSHKGIVILAPLNTLFAVTSRFLSAQKTVKQDIMKYNSEQQVKRINMKILEE